jgi:hypothetical protein
MFTFRFVSLLSSNAFPTRVVQGNRRPAARQQGRPLRLSAPLQNRAAPGGPACAGGRRHGEARAGPSEARAASCLSGSKAPAVGAWNCGAQGAGTAGAFQSARGPGSTQWPCALCHGSCAPCPTPQRLAPFLLIHAGAAAYKRGVGKGRVPAGPAAIRPGDNTGPGQEGTGLCRCPARGEPPAPASRGGGHQRSWSLKGLVGKRDAAR